MALMVLEDMIGIHKEAAAIAAITDSVRALLPIGYGMYQPCLGRSFQNFFGFLFCDLTAKTVIHNVMAQRSEMQAGLQFVFTRLGVRIEIFSLAAGTERHSTIIL